MNDKDDEIIYAKRKNRDVYTPFNISKKSQPSSVISIVLRKNDSKTYELQSAWIGSLDSPPFPGDENETSESKPYWTKHSLAYGTREIQPNTETNVCPW